MSDHKPNPVDDLKEGLGLLFRAAKGAVEKLPTDKLEVVAKDAAKEVGRAFESLGNEIEKLVGTATGTQPPAEPPAAPPAEAKKEEPPNGEAPKPPVQYDDGYAPEASPKGPRVG